MNRRITDPAFRFLAVKQDPVLQFDLVPEYGSPEPFVFDKDHPVFFNADNELLIAGMHEGKEFVHVIAAVKDIGGFGEAREALPETMGSDVIYGG